MIAKLFSVSANSPAFLKKFENGKILYMVRDPLSVIPSGLSLVTGVLDKKFKFWSLPMEKRQMFIEKLYRALIELLLRFEDDWTNNRIDKSRVMIVKFDRMMSDFSDIMNDILEFVEYNPSEEFLNDIKITTVKNVDEVLKLALVSELKPVEWIEVENLPKQKSTEKIVPGSTH